MPTVKTRDGREFWEGTFKTYPKAVEHLAYTVQYENEHAERRNSE